MWRPSHPYDAVSRQSSACASEAGGLTCLHYSLALVTSLPCLKAQEIPLDHPDSNNMFQPGPDKPFVATQAAIRVYSHSVIVACWNVLRQHADQHTGLDYLQVFEDESKPENLWFIEDGTGGAITALLPSDY